MDHLHIRCPSCAKLYQVEVGRIFSAAPEFLCQNCGTRFSFEFPPRDPLAIPTRVLEVASPAKPVKKCPRCGVESPAGPKECMACGVIFERLEGLPTDPSLKARPSLVRRWKEVLADYTNEALHSEFLSACREQDALEYARVQYKELRRLQGEDPIATRMLEKLAALRLKPLKINPPKKESNESSKAYESWGLARRWAVFSPYLLGALLVLLGLSRNGHRHMIGAGMALLILSFVIFPEAKRIFLDMLLTGRTKKRESR